MKRETTYFEKRHYRVAYHPLTRSGKNIWILQFIWIALLAIAAAISFFGLPVPLEWKAGILIALVVIGFIVEILILGYSNKRNLRGKDRKSRSRRTKKQY